MFLTVFRFWVNLAFFTCSGFGFIVGYFESWTWNTRNLERFSSPTSDGFLLKVATYTFDAPGFIHVLILIELDILQHYCFVSNVFLGLFCIIPWNYQKNIIPAFGNDPIRHVDVISQQQFPIENDFWESSSECSPQWCTTQLFFIARKESRFGKKPVEILRWYYTHHLQNVLLRHVGSFRKELWHPFHLVQYAVSLPWCRHKLEEIKNVCFQNTTEMYGDCL